MRSILIILITGILGSSQPIPSNVQITGFVFDYATSTPLSGVTVSVKGTTINTKTDLNGRFQVLVANSLSRLVVTANGFKKQEIEVGSKSHIKIFLHKIAHEVPEAEAEEISETQYDLLGAKVPMSQKRHKGTPGFIMSNQVAASYPEQGIIHNTESYSTIHENIFHDPGRKPLSTFSIDVDAASYSNVRRFLRQGQMPPKDAVRIEEMVNYFSYDYQQPQGTDPFAVNTELSTAPWNSNHRLLHIGIQGKRIPVENLPSSNLVFLIDVSGSMNSANKLGLLKSAFRLLVNQLRPSDKVSIVVYAGAAGMVLPPTSGSDKQAILSSLSNLQAGGSTAGGAGIRLAYKLAREQFVEEGNNRVILATDGDFNVGASSDAEMERLIEVERSHGVFLTVLGFGTGNYKDSKMETLADKGNGNYAYIDDIMEAKKVLVSEFGGTLFTIAKDVKIQVEFNPTHVKAYRLIGYENRQLNDEDFNDDRKDAGELGSGHTVTALYEIITHESSTGSGYIGTIDDLKYQQNNTTSRNFSDELMTLKLRYKQPQGNRSSLISKTVKAEFAEFDQSSNNLRWSAAVASFGMLLRQSEFMGSASYSKVEQWAKSARGVDQEGYRGEFIKLVQSVDLMAKH